MAISVHNRDRRRQDDSLRRPRTCKRSRRIFQFFPPDARRKMTKMSPGALASCTLECRRVGGLCRSYLDPDLYSHSMSQNRGDNIKLTRSDLDVLGSLKSWERNRDYARFWMVPMQGTQTQVPNAATDPKSFLALEISDEDLRKNTWARRQVRLLLWPVVPSRLFPLRSAIRIARKVATLCHSVPLYRAKRRSDPQGRQSFHQKMLSSR